MSMGSLLGVSSLLGVTPVVRPIVHGAGLRLHEAFLRITRGV